MASTDITIPESTLRDVVAAQLATKFSDPEIVQSFVASVLETRIDNFGRTSSNPKDPTMVRWAVESVIRRFVEETTNAWLKQNHQELIMMIGEELRNDDVLRRIAQETAAKVTVK